MMYKQTESINNIGLVVSAIFLYGDHLPVNNLNGPEFEEY